MDRRRAVTGATAASLTFVAAASAFAINSGVLAASTDETPGDLSPVIESETGSTAYVADGESPSSPAVSVSESAPTTTSGASSVYEDEDHEDYDEDDHEEDDHHEDDDDHEGRDDDD
jgi:hypothetical protein